MERHKCKLCCKTFVNGRALGGHMRSHMANLPIHRKLEEEEAEEQPGQLDDEASASSSSSSSSEDEDQEEEEAEEEVEEKGLSFAGSVVLQDRESETESSKNVTRRRSKRTRKQGCMLLEQHHHHHQEQDQHHQQRKDSQESVIKKVKYSQFSCRTESEPVSSISDATTDEDVAFCLMMLSRDEWKKKKKEKINHEYKQGVETYEPDEFKREKNQTRGKYKCETCKKVFKSYQALGGHRASHKKNRPCVPVLEPKTTVQESAGASSSVADKKIHECPVCFRVFSSGQALGGHKRSHGNGLTEASPAKSSTRESFIDLNLPAPIEDDDMISAVSNAEFLNCINR